MKKDAAPEEQAKCLVKLFNRLNTQDQYITPMAATILQSIAHDLIDNDTGSPLEIALVSTNTIISSLLTCCSSINEDILKLTEQVATLTGKIAKMEGVEQDETC